MKICRSLFGKTAMLTSLCGMCLWTSHAKADFDEAHYPSQDIDLAEVDGWFVQSHQNGAWGLVEEAVYFSRDSEGSESLTWRKTPAGGTQVRVVKLFPATTSDKVVVSFQINPGAEDLGGRLFFTRDIGEEKLMALRFHRGRLHFLESGRMPDVDTGVSFKPNEFNTVEVQIAFSEGRAKVLLNGEDAGDYEILDTQQAVGTMILYGGGEDHETVIKDLRVKSVTDFEQH